MIDETDIQQFVREDYARVVNAVALVAGDVHTAEDLVQEAIARAWSRSERGPDLDSLSSWIVAVSLNLARSRWRRVLAERRARARLTIPNASPPPGLDQIDVARALATLPRRQREMAVLRYLMDMTTREVADTLGVSEGTVKNSLAKARVALAAQLRIDDAEEVTRDVTGR